MRSTCRLRTTGVNAPFAPSSYCMSTSIAEPVSPISTSRTKTFSIVPPRTAFVLTRIPRSSCGLLIAQRSTNTSRTLPLTSLPIVTPPWPARIRQPRTTTRCEGVARRRPSAFRPDLIAMQSSPVSNSVSSISTSLDDSGSQPSLFGPLETTRTPRTITLRESTGWITHIGALRIVTPSISTFVQRYGSTNCGRR